MTTLFNPEMCLHCLGCTSKQFGIQQPPCAGSDEGSTIALTSTVIMKSPSLPSLKPEYYDQSSLSPSFAARRAYHQRAQGSYPLRPLEANDC